MNTCTKCDSPLPDLATTCYNCNSYVEQYNYIPPMFKACSNCSKGIRALVSKCYHCDTIVDQEAYGLYNAKVSTTITNPYQELINKLDMLEKRVSILEKG